MKKSYCKYLFSLLLFGSNGIVASRISLSSYEIVFFRTLIGSALLLALFLLTRQRFTFIRKKRDLLFVAGSGAAMGASWMFLFEAYRQIGVSLASLAYYCGPVIVMALSPLLFKERLTRPRLLGFAAVLFGVFLVNGQAVQSGETGWGLFCGAMSAVTYALMVIFNKSARNIAGLENSVLQLITAFVTLAVFLWLRQGLVIRVESGDWLPILFLGCVNTGLGCYLYFSSIGRLPVQTVAICGYLELLSAVVLSAVFLHERLSGAELAGAALILGGAVLGEAVRPPQRT